MLQKYFAGWGMAEEVMRAGEITVSARFKMLEADRRFLPNIAPVYPVMT
jgi:hypothetical protein